jgi:exosome complex exonuclease DIS3/RRP44
MAQQASRSSVELFTSLYFRNKIEVEEGRILRVLKNGFIVLVPKYGIETIVYTSLAADGPSPFNYDEEAKSLVAGDIVLKTFDSVKVEITVEGDADGMRQKMNMKLVEPFVEGISVIPSGTKLTTKRPNQDDAIESTIKKSKK